MVSVADYIPQSRNLLSAGEPHLPDFVPPCITGRRELRLGTME